MHCRWQDPPRHQTLTQTHPRPPTLPPNPSRDSPTNTFPRGLTNIGESNGLLRQYFPKRTDLRAYSLDDLKHAEQRLNNRPRKVLGWQTPTQVFTTAMPH